MSKASVGARGGVTLRGKRRDFCQVGRDGGAETGAVQGPARPKARRLVVLGCVSLTSGPQSTYDGAKVCLGVTQSGGPSGSEVVGTLQRVSTEMVATGGGSTPQTVGLGRPRRPARLVCEGASGAENVPT